MAILVDLDDAAEDELQDVNGNRFRERESMLPQAQKPGASNPAKTADTAPVVVSPANNTLERVLCIYPVAVEIASHIDTITLDSLARTCRAAHAGLVQYRRPLLASTLRCHQDTLPVEPKDTFRFRARASEWFLQSRQSSRLQNYNGKAGQCARDLVSECRRCLKVVCRNCTTKPPSPKALADRYRRLCEPCATAPLKDHINPSLDPDTPASADVIQQSICQCETSGVWLCQPCGKTMCNEDQTYLRIWNWRSRYIDVGVTDAERGIPCGREANCLAAVEKEVEIDSAGERTPSPFPSATASSSASASTSASPLPFLSDLDEPRSGYNVHEYKGAGGRVTNKTVVGIRVGRSVPEWHDEKASRRILGREVDGLVRSWCGWCWRVIPGREESGRA